MAQLRANRPTQHREEETWELIRFMNQVGREINAIAREFNSGHGAEAELNRMLQLLCGIYERVYKLRKKGYPYVG
jgi:hypothetical protein